MKKIFLILLFLVSAARADTDPAWVNLCAGMTKMQGIVAQWTVFPSFSPLAPYVGITTGMIQQNNVILEICDLVEALEKADTLRAVDVTKNTLNKMTNNKWMEKLGFDDEQFEFVRDNLMDPDSDTNRGKWMEQRIVKEIDNYAINMKKAQDENFEQSARSVEEREKEDEQRRRLANSAKNVAVLRETIQCPDSKDKPNFTKIYNNDVVPQEAIKEESEKDSEYFYDQLKSLGKMLSSSPSDLDVYFSSLSMIKNSGSYMERSVGKTTESTQVIGTSKGQKVMKTASVNKKFYLYSAKENDYLFSDFKEKYDKKFKNYVKYMYLTDTSRFGLFGDADKRVEKTFRNLSFECSERRLMKGINEDSENYYSNYEKKKEDCEISLKTNQADSESLLSKYLNELRISLFQNRQAIASIWSTESKYLGIHRVSQSNDTEGVVSQNETTCDGKFTQKEIEVLKAKAKVEELNLRAQTAELMKKKTDRKKMRQDKMDKEYKEYMSRKEFERAESKFKDEASNKPMGIPQLKSKIELKK